MRTTSPSTTTRPFRRSQRPRRGAAAMELAIVVPLLILLLFIGFDYCRIFYYSQTLTNCARNGALYGSDPPAAATSPYKSLSEAALADAKNLEPQPTVKSTAGSDASGNAYVEVAVSWQFHTLSGFPGIPKTVDLQRKVRMRIAPSY